MRVARNLTLALLATVAAVVVAAALGGEGPRLVAAQVATEPDATVPAPVPPVEERPVHRRLWFAAPRRGVQGRKVELAVRRRARDRDGRYQARLCVRPPALGWGCRKLVLRDGVRRIAPPQLLAAPGRWLFQLRNGKQRLRRSTVVAPRGGRLKVLVTGDSMAQIYDHYMREGLGGRATVRSEAHISTGISKPSMLDWQAKARAQAGGLRPDVTVVFIGANDGFPMRTPSGATANCCGSAWVEEYARRAADMMRSYRRGRAGRVYWLTLPAPRSGSFRSVFGPVNAAIRKAARRTRGVEVVPIDRIFTPGFVYRDAVKWGNRWVNVRQADGVHLNNAGAQLAAQRTIGRMRADRVLGR